MLVSDFPIMKMFVVYVAYRIENRRGKLFRNLYLHRRYCVLNTCYEQNHADRVPWVSPGGACDTREYWRCEVHCKGNVFNVYRSMLEINVSDHYPFVCCVSPSNDLMRFVNKWLFNYHRNRNNISNVGWLLAEGSPEEYNEAILIRCQDLGENLEIKILSSIIADVANDFRQEKTNRPNASERRLYMKHLESLRNICPHEGVIRITFTRLIVK